MRSYLAQLLFTVLMGTALYGCLVIIAQPHGIGLPTGNWYFNWFVFSASPPAALLLSIIGWGKARQYRRMEAVKGTPIGAADALVRGMELPERALGTSSLERLSSAAILFSVTAIIFWLQLESPWLWVLGSFAGFWAIRALLR